MRALSDVAIRPNAVPIRAVFMTAGTTPLRDAGGRRMRYSNVDETIGSPGALGTQI